MSHALATDNCFWPTGCSDRGRCNEFGQCIAHWQAEHKHELFNGPSTGESSIGLKETSPGRRDAHIRLRAERDELAAILRDALEYEGYPQGAFDTPEWAENAFKALAP